MTDEEIQQWIDDRISDDDFVDDETFIAEMIRLGETESAQYRKSFQQVATSNDWKFEGF